MALFEAARSKHAYLSHDDLSSLPLKCIRALAAIAPTTLLQLSHADGSAIRDFALLSKSVPVYSLELGSEMDQVPALLRGVLAI